MTPVTRFLVAACAIVYALGCSSPGWAGATGGSGTVNYSNSETGLLEKFLKRNKIGVEYGLENQEFQNQLKDLLAKGLTTATINASGLSGDDLEDAQAIKDIIFGIRTEIKRIKYADQNGIDFTFAHKSFRTILEIGLKYAEKSGAITPGTHLSVKVGKVAAAFIAAYSWGFMFG
jgi:hypothetical protein